MKIGINKKLLASFLIGVLFASALFVWSIFTVNVLINTTREIESLALRVEKTDDLIIQIQKMLKASDDYLITGDIVIRDRFDVIITEMSDILGVIERQKGDRRWLTAWSKVRGGVRTLGEMTVEIMFVDDPVGSSEAAELMARATIFAESLSKDLEEFNRIASEDMREKVEYAHSKANSTRAMLVIFPLAGVLLLFVLYYYLRNYISKPLMELYRGSEVLSKGNFDHKVRVGTGDELEQLAEGFNSMADALKEREAKLTSLIKVADKVNRDLIAASQHKAAFLSNISHELKTPLTHVLGFSELLKLEASGKLPKTTIKYVDNIRNGGEELLRLINNLLDVAKASGGAIVPELEEIDVKEVVDEVIEDIRPLAEANEQTLDLELSDELGSIKADEGMFRQMIANLLDNAVKFTPRQGEIKLKVFEDVEKDARVLRVHVKDTGVGIAPGLRESIFNPFEVGEESMRKTHGGMGTGLALTKRFVEFHGGNISVSSKVGKGSTFKFYIPIGTRKE